MAVVYNIIYKFKFDLEENKTYFKDIFNEKLVNVLVNQEKSRISDDNS